MDVKFSDLSRTYALYREEYEEAALRALRSGWYVMGSELEAFEQEFAAYVGKRHGIGVGCGQDALILAIRALGIGTGDEVIVAGNTYIATVLGVTENGATPVFVDCDEYFQIDVDKLEQALTARTKAVLVTNLYGQTCRLSEVRRICDAHGLWMVEDCAQSHGARWQGRMSGTWADVSCFSFYPTKPLGAMGDAGACLTDDRALAERIRMLRNYGSRTKYVNEVCGVNSRLDEVQAALLRVGLARIDEMRRMREDVAERYLSDISCPAVSLPKVRADAENVWHIFPLLCEERDELKRHLDGCGVHTQIHYPVPPHRAQCYEGRGYGSAGLPLAERFASEELSLPIYAGMPDNEVDAVIRAVNSFKGRA